MELIERRRYSLLIVDEFGYTQRDYAVTNLFFQLGSSRYWHASLSRTSNLPFTRWREVFGDATTASARTEHIVHHADVISMTRQLPA